MPIDLPIRLRPPGARYFSARKRAANMAPARTPARHGYVKAFDGTRLFYSVEGTGKPLIFCYGLVCSSLHWTYQIEYFHRNYQAVWFDYRGHNNSDIPKDLSTLTLDSCARDLTTVLDELGIKDAVFLGHSMGVNVVLEFARRHPERVAGMVLANGTAKRPLENLFRHNALQGVFRLLKRAHAKKPELVSLLWKLQKGNPLARTLVTFGGFNPHLTSPADVSLYVDQVADMDPAILIHLIDSYDASDATPWLHTLLAPALIVAGEIDKLTPLDQQELMRQLSRNSRLETIRHGSHCPQMDLPDLVNARIESFLKEIGYVSSLPAATASGSTPTKENASRSTGKHPTPDPLAPA